tara:strand:- start:779 stop:1423 length:645 start_codon:yes stop_codon:yes gene_type:complete
MVDNNIINHPPRKHVVPVPKVKNSVVYTRSLNLQPCKSKCCFWDCHEFEGTNYGLPLDYDGNTFTLWGNFCSLECARAFAFSENNIRSDRSESLVALMGVKLFGNSTHVSKAPSKYILEKFGGPVSIEDYRRDLKTQQMWVVNSVHCKQTNLVCDVYYKETKFIPHTEKNSVAPENKKVEKSYAMELRREDYPAHQTKSSLKNLLGKKRALPDS